MFDKTTTRRNLRSSTANQKRKASEGGSEVPIKTNPESLKKGSSKQIDRKSLEMPSSHYISSNGKPNETANYIASQDTIKGNSSEPTHKLTVIKSTPKPTVHSDRARLVVKKEDNNKEPDLNNSLVSAIMDGSSPHQKVYEEMKNVNFFEHATNNEVKETYNYNRRIPPKVSMRNNLKMESAFEGDSFGAGPSSQFDALYDYEEPSRFETFIPPSEDASIENSLPIQKNTEKRGDTTAGKWNPIAFVENNMFDMERGIPLSRDQCEEAIKKLSKNIREVDYYPFLELAENSHNISRDSQKLAFGLAFTTIVQNQVIAKLRKQLSANSGAELAVVDGIGFSLDAAKQEEDWIELPSGKKFKMSSLVSSQQASKWTSSKFEENSKSLFRVAFKKLAMHDEFFACYSPLDYSTSGYFPLGSVFYKKVAKFVYGGFKQHFSLEIESKCIGMAQEVLNYLLDRFRKELNSIPDMSVKKLADKLHNFIGQAGTDLEYEEIDFNKHPVHLNFKSLKYHL